MNIDGLLVKPEFNNPKYYLQSGKMTQISDIILKAVSYVQDDDPKEMVKQLLVLMNKYVPKKDDSQSDKKFRRTADEIAISSERNGCCDSSTLFVTLVRALGIPAMQVITFNKNSARETDGTDKGITSGHFFSACFFQDGWFLVDSHKTITDKSQVEFRRLSLDNRNITKRFYAFAYAIDYRDIEIEGLKIDSIPNMNRVQKIAYELCDKSQIDFENEKER